MRATGAKALCEVTVNFVRLLQLHQDVFGQNTPRLRSHCVTLGPSAAGGSAVSKDVSMQ